MKPNFHQYHITETGKIYLNDEYHPTKTDKAGNIVAYLRIDRKGKRVQMAHVIYDLYREPRHKNKRSIIFIDGNKANLHPDNLEAVTTSRAGSIAMAKVKRKETTATVDINKISWV